MEGQTVSNSRLWESSTTTVAILTVALLTSILTAETRIPVLSVVPETTLVDQPVTIEVTGCRPDELVVLRATCIDDTGLRWEGHAAFAADQDGRVEPAKQEPKQGTYDYVDPMGLFWSMVNNEGPAGQTVFANKKLEPLEVLLQLEIDGEVVASKQLTRLRVYPSVIRREVRESGLVGTLFLPQTEGPVGAIIVLGGSSGGRRQGIAALLSSHGFATLALAYFNDESLPEELVEIPLEYFETAIDFLGEQVAIDASRIAVFGGSRGAELALLLGATFPQVCAVVAYAPGSLVSSGCCSPQASRKAAWTYRGKPIVPLKNDWSDPEIQALRKEIESEIKAGKPVAWARGTRLKVEKALNLEEASIPVEKIRGPILFISGKEDALWPSAELAEISMTRLRELRFAHQFEHLSYEDAGHQIWIPFLPTTVTARRHPLSGIVLEYGGTPVGIAKASADSWPRVLTFFRDVLGSKEE